MSKMPNTAYWKHRKMITTLTGNNSYLIFSKLRQLEQDFLKSNEQIGIEKFDGVEVDPAEFIAAIKTMSLFAPKRLLIVYDLSANKILAEQIEQIISSVSDTTSLVIIEANPDKRTSYYKNLQKLTDLQEFRQLDENQALSWIKSYVKDMGGEISSSDAKYLVGRLSVDQQLLHNELDKLIAYQPKVTTKTIDLLVEPTPQSSVFELLDTAFAGNKHRTLSIYNDQRQQNVEPLAILGMIGWQLHALAIVSLAGDRNVDTIARETRLNPFVIRKSQALLKQRSFGQIKQLIDDTLKTDIRLKSQYVDEDEALMQLLIRIAQ